MAHTPYAPYESANRMNPRRRDSTTVSSPDKHHDKHNGSSTANALACRVRHSVAIYDQQRICMRSKAWRSRKHATPASSRMLWSQNSFKTLTLNSDAMSYFDSGLFTLNSLQRLRFAPSANENTVAFCKRSLQDTLAGITVAGPQEHFTQHRDVENNCGSDAHL